MKGWTDAAGVGFSVVMAIVFCSMAFGVAQSQINHNAESIETLEADRQILWELRTDVQWIRARMDRLTIEHRNPLSTPQTPLNRP